MTRAHITPDYFLDPTHPITVILVGCGGTGSQVLSCLARMNETLKALNHPGLHVTAYDADIVTEANKGRQLFSEVEIGRYKSEALITRFNRFYGTAWQSVQDNYTCDRANIIVTCVDNVKSRLRVSDSIKSKEQSYEEYLQLFYWLDFGNLQKTGQVVLGTFNELKQPHSNKYQTIGKLPCVTELFNLSQIDETEAGPSCSVSQAISKQDLFINSTLANLGCNILWKLFREQMIFHSGLYLNLQTMNVNPIPV